MHTYGAIINFDVVGPIKKVLNNLVYIQKHTRFGCVCVGTYECVCCKPHTNLHKCFRLFL